MTLHCLAKRKGGAVCLSRDVVVVGYVQRTPDGPAHAAGTAFELPAGARVMLHCESCHREWSSGSIQARVAYRRAFERSHVEFSSRVVGREVRS